MNLGTLRFCIFFLLISLCACKEKKYLTSISDKLIIEVLIDVHLANALIDKQTNEDKDSLKEKYMIQIANMHQLSRPSFDSIVNYVHFDINRYKSISAAVEDSLSSIKNTIQEKKKASIKR